MGSVCGHLHGNMAISYTSLGTNPISYTAKHRNLILTPLSYARVRTKGAGNRFRGGERRNEMRRFAALTSEKVNIPSRRRAE